MLLKKFDILGKQQKTYLSLQFLSNKEVKDAFLLVGIIKQRETMVKGKTEKKIVNIKYKFNM